MGKKRSNERVKAKKAARDAAFEAEREQKRIVEFAQNKDGQPVRFYEIFSFQIV